MAEQFYTILTDIGKAKIANAVALGTTVQISEIAVGDGGGAYYNPSETQTTLVNEVWRGAVSRVDVDPNNPNWIVVEAVIPPDVGGFYIREVGIFDSAGDLIAIGKYPETYKPTFTNNNTSKDLVIRAILEVSNASAVELKVDPTVVIASQQYVQDEIASHNADVNAHGDIRDDLSTHIADTTAHNIPAQIDAHNNDPNAHPNIFKQDVYVSGIRFVPPNNGQIVEIEASPTSLLVAVRDDVAGQIKFYRSTDEGVTWSSIPDLDALAVSTSTPYPRLKYITDGTNSVWILQIRNNPVADSTFYVSYDDGVTWQQLSLPANLTYAGVTYDTIGIPYDIATDFTNWYFLCSAYSTSIARDFVGIVASYPDPSVSASIDMSLYQATAGNLPLDSVYNATRTKSACFIDGYNSSTAQRAFGCLYNEGTDTWVTNSNIDRVNVYGYNTSLTDITYNFQTDEICVGRVLSPDRKAIVDKYLNITRVVSISLTYSQLIPLADNILLFSHVTATIASDNDSSFLQILDLRNPAKYIIVPISIVRPMTKVTKLHNNRFFILPSYSYSDIIKVEVKL